MSNRTDKDYLCDIQEAIHRIFLYTDSLSYDIFLTDSKTQDAVIRNLEILGEATKKLSSKLRIKYPGVPWKNMSSVRDRLIHNYFGLNLDIVWQIIETELPKVTSYINIIFKEKLVQTE